MTKPIKHTAATVTRGEKYGFLTVIRPRIRIQSGMPFHSCKCACGNPDKVAVSDHKLRGASRVSCLKCKVSPVHFCMPKDQTAEQCLVNFVARNGPWHIEDQNGKYLWVRYAGDFIPFPYHLCTGDVVLVGTTYLFGPIKKIRSDRDYEVEINGKIKLYRADQLLLIHRPGLCDGFK